MFYSMPRDALQDAAAAELYNRHWRYHKELRLWLMKDQSSEQSKTPTFERGSYIFFDPNSWEKVKKDFIVMYDALEERRQGPPALQQQANGSSGTAVTGSGGVVGPNGTVGSGVVPSSVNGMDGAHAGLLNNLNMTASSTAGPGSSSLSGTGQQGQQQQLKQSGLSQNFQMQQQQQQRQQQQQQQHQKSLHMMNHGLFAPNNNHGFQGVKPQ